MSKKTTRYVLTVSDDITGEFYLDAELGAAAVADRTGADVPRELTTYADVQRTLHRYGPACLDAELTLAYADGDDDDGSTWWFGQKAGQKLPHVYRDL